MTSSPELPLNHQSLFEVLQAASSTNQVHLQLATAQLKEWETTPGYWSLLQDAFLDTSLPKDVRWMSVITLKYGVERFWRKTATKYDVFMIRQRKRL